MILVIRVILFLVVIVNVSRSSFLIFAASRAVGITGQIDLVEIDGPRVVVSLNGRFWHATDTVMMRVESFFKQRIPEILEVSLDMTKSKIVDDNRLNTEKGERKLF